MWISEPPVIKVPRERPDRIALFRRIGQGNDASKMLFEQVLYLRWLVAGDVYTHFLHHLGCQRTGFRLDSCAAALHRSTAHLAQKTLRHLAAHSVTRRE